MIEIDEQSFIKISNWDKHQSLEGLEEIREQGRQRVAKHREKKRLESGNATSNVTCNENVTDIDKELDIDNIYVEIINYLNRAAGKNFRHTTPATRKSIKMRVNEGFQLEDFKTVIDNKIADWLNNNDDMSQRPNTLFGTKFSMKKLVAKGNSVDIATLSIESNLENFGGASYINDLISLAYPHEVEECKQLVLEAWKSILAIAKEEDWEIARVHICLGCDQRGAG